MKKLITLTALSLVLVSSAMADTCNNGVTNITRPAVKAKIKAQKPATTTATNVGAQKSRSSAQKTKTKP